MSHTYRGPTREQHRRTIRRLRQQDRNRQHEPTRTQVETQAMVQSLWEQSIDFFANSSGNTDSAKEDSGGQAK